MDGSFSPDGRGGPIVCYAIHENGSQEVRLQYETAYPLTVGGGKPGQSYPCILAVCNRGNDTGKGHEDAESGLPRGVADHREENE